MCQRCGKESDCMFIEKISAASYLLSASWIIEIKDADYKYFLRKKTSILIKISLCKLS